MSTKHTPGDWKFQLYAGTASPEQLKKLNLEPVRNMGNDGSVPILCGSRRIASVNCLSDYKRGHGHEAECPERDANARLISAAPDLLAACQRIVRIGVCTCADYGPDKAPDCICDWCETRNAVAKAEGGAA